MLVELGGHIVFRDIPISSVFHYAGVH